jgi:hypothetical protein
MIKLKMENAVYYFQDSLILKLLENANFISSEIMALADVVISMNTAVIKDRYHINLEKAYDTLFELQGNPIDYEVTLSSVSNEPTFTGISAFSRTIKKVFHAKSSKGNFTFTIEQQVGPA